MTPGPRPRSLPRFPDFPAPTPARSRERSARPRRWRRPRRAAPGRPAMGQAEDNAGGVQHPSRGHETQAVEQAVGARRKFRAVGVAMEYRERRGQQPGCPIGRSGLEQHHRAQHQGGEGDAEFDARQRHAEQSEQAAQGHHHGKGDRQQPDRPSPELCAPQAHGDHGEHVVEAGHGMPEAHEEAGRFTAEGVCGRRRSREQTGGGCPCRGMADAADYGVHLQEHVNLPRRGRRGRVQ